MNLGLRRLLVDLVNRALRRLDAKLVRVSALEGPQTSGNWASSKQGDFLWALLSILITDKLAAILSAWRPENALRVALVGDDRYFADNVHYFMDSGLRLTGVFEGSDSFLVQSRPLDALDPHEFDLVIVNCAEPGKELSLLAQLRENQALQRSDLPVLRLAHLYRTVAQVVSTLRRDAFHTALSPSKLAVLAICTALAPPGTSIVEAGVFMGGGTIWMAKIREAFDPSTHLFALDTFEGLPAPTTQDGSTPFVEGLMKQDIEQVRHFYRLHGVDHRITVVKGLVEETIGSVEGRMGQIGLALLDMDQYSGTRAGLEAVLPRLAPRGYVVIDDSSWEGVRRAIDEAVGKQPQFRTITPVDSVDVLFRSDQRGLFSELSP